MIDYESLKLIWWLLVGVLLIGFAIMDGHDMGVGALLPFVGRSDDERRVVINTVGPHWDGNQVWFITAGGAIFAAWPLIYATAFSGFYWALLLVLWALFLRPVGFDYRSKIADPRWRTTWDWALFVGGAVPALVFGVAFGNVIQGVPFHFDDRMLPIYTGSFLSLFNAFALVSGVVSLSMLLFHGATYLQLRTEGRIGDRARAAALIFGTLSMLAFSFAGLMVAGLDGHRITSLVLPGEVLSPVGKSVSTVSGGWLENFQSHSALWGAPALAYLGGALGLVFTIARQPGWAFVGSALTCTGVILTAGVAMFPFVLPSSSHPAHGLTVWDCVSSQRTLNIMFWVALVMTPIVLAYTSWAYRVMRGKVTLEQVRTHGKALY